MCWADLRQIISIHSPKSSWHRQTLLILKEKDDLEVGGGITVVFYLLEIINITFQIKTEERRRRKKILMLQILCQENLFQGNIKNCLSQEVWATAIRVGKRKGTWTEQDVLSDFMILLTLKGIHWDVSALVILQILNLRWLEGLLNTYWGLTFAAFFSLSPKDHYETMPQNLPKCERLWEVTKTGSEGLLGAALKKIWRLLALLLREINTLFTSVFGMPLCDGLVTAILPWQGISWTARGM